MAPQRPEDGFVRMPDAEFEAILTRATEVGQLWCQVSLAESPNLTGYVSADYLRPP